MKAIEFPGMFLPETDDATRKEFLIGAASLLLLPAACGSNGESGEASGETRTVEHALGTTEVPASPERVVVTDSQLHLDAALSLGAPVVGTGQNVEGEDGFIEAIGREFGESGLDGIEFTGGSDQPNLEKIALLEPDLVITYGHNAENNYEQWSRIAPTVALDFVPWEEQHLKIGEALGKGRDARSLMSDFRAATDEIEACSPEGMITQVVRLDAEQITLYGLNGAWWNVEMDVDWLAPEGAEEEGGGYLYLSIEQIEVLAPADNLLILATDPDERDLRREIERNPLWRRLPAVRNGRTLDIDLSYWNGGYTSVVEGLFPRLRDFWCEQG